MKQRRRRRRYVPDPADQAPGRDGLPPPDGAAGTGPAEDAAPGPSPGSAEDAPGQVDTYAAPAGGKAGDAPDHPDGPSGPTSPAPDAPEPGAKGGPAPAGEDPAHPEREGPGEDADGAEESAEAPEEGGEPEDEYYEEYGDDPYEDEEDEPRPSLGRRLLRAVLVGLLKLIFWLLMVALCVLGLVAAVGYFLYQSTTADQLPAANVSFAGQTLIATDYSWEVPVMGPLRRGFNLADSLAPAEGEGEEEVPPPEPPEDPQLLQTVDSVSPALSLPASWESRLEVLPAGETEPVFSGDAEAFSRFAFAENGTYDATLTIGLGEESEPDLSEPVGHYTYHFRFTLAAKPRVTLSSDPVVEGSVLGLRVTGLTGDVSPWVSCEWGSASFVRQGGGWTAYLALPESFLAGEYPLEIVYGDTRETVMVHTVYRQTQELDTFTADGSAAIPYMGAAPSNIRPLFEIADPEIYWADTGFIQPVQGRTVRNYAVVEYTDRVVDKELLAADPAWVEYNKTIPGRLSLNVTFATRPGAEIVAPADGRVVFAGIAAGSRCVVIEHGCGLKSLFYLLARIDVAEGDYVSQGTLLGTAQGHTICEVRLGDSPLNPWEVWGNYGGLFF